jgi:signal transduction histidine kinase
MPLSCKLTVLIIEDDAVDREAVRRLLDPDRYALAEATSGLEGLDLARQSAPDCVLLDYRLSDSDGLELQRSLLEIAPYVPVIMLTGQGSEWVAVEAMKRGAADYLVKGALTRETLQRAIDGAVTCSSLQERLDAKQREIDDILSIAYNDLRAPLGQVDLAARKVRALVDGDAKNEIDAILANNSTMRALVDDLLDFARADQPDPRAGLVDLAASLEEALDDLRAKIEESGARIDHDPLPAVYGSPRSLRRLLRDLLDNAIKFRGEGKPVVRVETQRAEGMWKVSVIDEGRGFDEAFVAHAFEPFRRHASNGEPGNGIGLAICRRIVEHHHGRIWIDSSPGQGARVHFTLPAAG